MDSRLVPAEPVGGILQARCPSIPHQEVQTTALCRSLGLQQPSLAEVRKELMQMIEQEQEVDGVYQINLQVFPLTTDTGERKR